MKLFILCGGNGSRMKDYSFPKPLNMIYGKPAIYYTLKHIPDFVTTLHFIVAPHLVEYNFDEIITNLFPNKICIFLHIPYFTRGALESAYIGVNTLVETNEPIVFLDNDVYFTFPDDFLNNKDQAFLGYSEDTSNTESFSFIKLNDEKKVIDFKEKIRISSLFCCGIYGFSNISQFRKYAKKVLDQPLTKEYYMSCAYEDMIKENIIINGIYFHEPIHIGSLDELQLNISKLPLPMMRICFDLDNTLVTYPTIHGDYSTVKPIFKMINLLRFLKQEGHTIIIYTARRMGTHKHNLGVTIKDIGYQTFKTLEEFNIPYDELLFGKPLADIYIDDRAINPYRHDITSMGIFQMEEYKPINMLFNNKYNTIKIKKDKICKCGPSHILDGEIFYYEHLPEGSIRNYFPIYYGSKKIDNGMSELYIENIPSVPFYTLFQNNQITTFHIDKIFEFMDCLHSIVSMELPTKDLVIDNYIQKLKERFSNIDDYPFENAIHIQNDCLEKLDKYCISEMSIVPYIHGDLWFSNILVDFKNNIHCIDMKGKLYTTYSTGGDKLYDYAKLYQSFLGYDAILYNHTIDEKYMQSMLDYFKECLVKRNISIQVITVLTYSLLMGTFHSIESIETKRRVWNWIVTTFYGL
jgi:capsule biosynthesis phosphatase